MKRTVTSASGVLPQGTLTFYDASLAPLTAGSYTLTVTQTVGLNSPDVDDPADYVVRQPVVVTAPQFQLLPADVQSVYPPGNHVGAFAEALPHVVLGRDLPWARPITPGTAGDTTPWLALLVVYDATESALVKGPVPTKVADLVTPASATVLPPALGALPAATLDQVCQVLTVDLPFFQQVIPALPEVPLLAHARNVDSTQKVTGLASGFWSLVIANRLPDASTTEARGTTVYLVSLEGHAAHLFGSTISGGFTSIALAVLASWKFTSSAFPGDFLGMLQAISTSGQDRLLQMPTQAAPDANAAAQEAITIGFVPLQNDLRTGERTTSWVRGAIVPYPTQADPITTTYPVSDHAIRYDPETGMFDHSYACAWQVGRLLALSDAGFVQEMVAWRRANLAAARSASARTYVAKMLAIGPERDAEGESTALNALACRAAGRLAALAEVELPQRRRRAARNLAAAPAAQSTAESLRERVAEGEDPLDVLLSSIQRAR